MTSKNYLTKPELIPYYERCAKECHSEEAKSFQKAADYLRGTRLPNHDKFKVYRDCRALLEHLLESGHNMVDIATRLDLHNQQLYHILNKRHVSKSYCEALLPRLEALTSELIVDF